MSLGEIASGIIIIDSGETISPGIVSSEKTTSDENIMGKRSKLL